MDTATTAIPTVPGTPFAGGFFAGLIHQADGIYALVVAPKAEGEHEDCVWGAGKARARLAGAMSFFDGRANTEAMAAADSALAKWARGLAIGGFGDWYLPARDELELAYRNLKPTAEKNYCWQGDNPSSVPPGYAYMPGAPAQTAADAFKDDGAEAFDTVWYWTSTQYAGDEAYAWVQHFDDGDQSNGHKDDDYRARAVRRVKVQ